MMTVAQHVDIVTMHQAAKLWSNIQLAACTNRATQYVYTHTCVLMSDIACESCLHTCYVAGPWTPSRLLFDTAPQRLPSVGLVE